jgi:hypothetical protein
MFGLGGVLHTCPQPPQLLTSVCSLTQLPPEQSEKPLLQEYPQLPPEQVGEAFGTLVVHETGLLHWPVELHVWTPFPEHCVAPGVQLPVQPPLMQT